MKRSLTLTLLLTAALPLCADEPKPARPESAAGEVATTTSGPEESPLVRAARRANRLGKKPGVVITNESVKKSRGHITTTSVQPPIEIPYPSVASDEAPAVRKRELTHAAPVRLIDEKKKKQQEVDAVERRARAAEMAEEGYFEDPEDDPARAERVADQGGRDDGNPPAANTTSGQKPPQH